MAAACHAYMIDAFMLWRREPLQQLPFRAVRASWKFQEATRDASGNKLKMRMALPGPQPWAVMRQMVYLNGAFYVSLEQTLASMPVGNLQAEILIIICICICVYIYTYILYICNGVGGGMVGLEMCTVWRPIW